MVLEPPSQPLTYSISGSSEPSGPYVAQNVMVDRPGDLMSRWSGNQRVPIEKHWITLRLELLGVVTTITFGKWSKGSHACNMKEFRLYIGTSEDKMTEILHSSLKDDEIPETFALKHINREGFVIPTAFVKICPLSAHGGHNFNTSIWFISMTGITDPLYLRSVSSKYEQYCESKILSLILTHLRGRRLLTPLKSILASISTSKFTFEHALITNLHTALVLNGDFSKSESLLREMSFAGFFAEYLRSCQPYSVWKRLHGVNADGDIPCKRGGHAMCIDSQSSKIYLLGGWDGQKTLDDFWVYDIEEDKWHVISHGTAKEKNGPGPRSCHKMVFDTKTGCIYLLGRLGTTDGPNVAKGDGLGRTVAYCSEFYRYHTRGLDAGKWDLLSFDTASSGGPPLIFDHQMVIDSPSQMIYVFGGRVVDGDWRVVKCAGLYSYNVKTSKWRMLQSTDAPTPPSRVHIPPRFGHSMILDHISHTLYIFAGQYNNHYLSDMYTYNLYNGTITQLYSNFTQEGGGPDSCFTQRAVGNLAEREIYVFCGLTRSNPSSHSVLQCEAPNWIYTYTSGTHSGKWTQILRSPANSSSPSQDVDEPQARYAHQVVFDPGRNAIFMFGGNAGVASGGQESERANLEAEDGADMEDTADSGDTNGRDGEGADADAGGGADGGTSVNTEDDGKTEKGDDAEEKEEEDVVRLDDLWRLELRRPEPEEIIRRAMFQIRRQQFREMSQTDVPVKALNFLQNEVYSVVNHEDPDETAIFRNLLGLLLAPPLSSVVPSATRGPQTMERRQSSGTRTRSNTPDDEWTSALDEDEAMVDIASPPPPVFTGPRPTLPLPMRKRAISADILRSVPDPLESIGDAAGGGTREDLSAERYKQRMDVFDSLLLFVGEEWKAPSGSLVDIVDREIL